MKDSVFINVGGLCLSDTMLSDCVSVRLPAWLPVRCGGNSLNSICKVTPNKCSLLCPETQHKKRV